MMNWKGCDAPGFPPTKGSFVQIEALRFEEDAAELFAAIGGKENDDLWRYMPIGPYDSAEELIAVLGYMAKSDDWQTLVFRSASSAKILGMASYMRIRNGVGSAEVGAVVFSKELQRTAAASEAVFFMARHLFDDLGYRRFEWKCDLENVASGRAAERFGFTAEGIFRQDMVVKGRNRDTAWFSMLDVEWPRIRSAFERWLAPDNFDSEGQQLESLQKIRAGLA